MRTHGVGLIGAGVIATEHAEACRRLAPRLRLVAAADVDATRLQRLAANYLVPFLYADYRELLRRDDVDIVAVCTPPVLHEEMVLAALSAGKHVVCEKPLAHSVAAADRIIACAARYPGRLSVVYQLRYLPEVRRILWLRDHDRLGQLKFGHFTRFDRASAAGVSNWWGKWKVAGGGLAMTQFVHQLDLMCTIFGRPVSVAGWMDTCVAPIESEDTFAATVHFENGATATCTASLAAQRTVGNWDVFGTKAAVHVPWSYESSDAMQQARDLMELSRLYPTSDGSGTTRRSLPVRAARKLLRKAHLVAPAPPVMRPCGHADYYADFLRALESDAATPISPESARVSLELCTAIYAAAISGRTIQLPLDRSAEYCQGFDTRVYDRGQVVHA